jgi:hypothetical protein
MRDRHFLTHIRPLNVPDLIYLGTRLSCFIIAFFLHPAKEKKSKLIPRYVVIFFAAFICPSTILSWIFFQELLMPIKILLMISLNFYLRNRCHYHNTQNPASGVVEYILYLSCKVKVKESRNRPGVAQRLPGGFGSQISMTFGTRRWSVRHPHAPAAFTPGNVPGTHFH